MRNWPDVQDQTAIPSSPTPRANQRGGRAMASAAGVMIALGILAFVSGSHVIFALVAIPVVVALAWSNPQAMLVLLPVWMVAMGLIRRLTPGGGNVTFSGDPVLIIGPAALLVMWLAISAAREPGKLTPLARAVLIFNAIAFIQAFNPSQGTLMTGIGGLLFILVPTAAFWIGRRNAEPELVIRVIWTVAILGLLAAAYGLYQQFVGFPSWDSRWISSKGYTALNVGGGITRAFSSFSSGQEYAEFLAVAAVAWVALLGKRTRWPILLHLAALAVVVDALYYEAQRTSMFLFALALGVMAAARIGMRPLGVMVAGVLAVVGLITFAGALGGSGGGGGALAGTPSAANVLSNRQLSGITNPTGSGSSLNGHLKATRQGINSGILHPLGHGTGSVNLAAKRYTAHSKLHGTEFDPGNMGVAFGLPGLIIYVVLLFTAMATAYRIAVRRRDAIGMFVLGICAAVLFQWTNGDLYSVCYLVWFALGVGDGLLTRMNAEPESVEPENVELSSLPDDRWSWRRPGESRRLANNW